ncbi:polysaccharide lyase family 7 protein [Paraglaciecola aquimarina]|uniref:Polysaccharide lyase family 7 protein n=1 Tax=Paraglaciecola aquimarina TaxID=1235557 RepID=A0ABU3SUV4_9ALTE|nr:polysaccharide lyase family 7 protein [Paraglaciecola aquimarina]MDU0353771.1 polysaccharide lyase family 7 protein [Paraglaciecola aquimarina]
MLKLFLKMSLALISTCLFTTAQANTLDPTQPPSSNFDLTDWNISIPIDSNKDGKADTVPEKYLAKGFTIKPFFYTGQDGAMVFMSHVGGAKTSKNTKYSRTELREMLRRGKTTVATKGLSKNNWLFSTVSSREHKKVGGIDGRLEATLAVNAVTTTGDPKQVGRVIVGQIHAKDDEPARLYYRKLPNNTKGSLYLAHEPLGGDDQYYEFVGSRASNAKDPEDGVALNEKFSYIIDVKGHTLTVTISRVGKPDITHVVNMEKSGYDKKDQYMYFKAGVYNQNNTGDPNDYTQASFYRLVNSHKNYKH